MTNKIINVMEEGLLLDYEDWDSLNDIEQDKYFTQDDFSDCDFITLKGEHVLDFILVDGKIYYYMYPEFELEEDFFIKVLENFLDDDKCNKTFKDVDTWTVTPQEEKEYEQIKNNSLLLFFRGGCGYVYSVSQYLQPITEVLK